MITWRTKKHMEWIRKQRERYPHGLEISPDGDAVCQSCFCIGNNECGLFPAGDDCSLDSDIECPCCNITSKPMIDTEYDKEVGQARLF